MKKLKSDLHWKTNFTSAFSQKWSILCSSHEVKIRLFLKSIFTILSKCSKLYIYKSEKCILHLQCLKCESVKHNFNQKES